MNKVMPSIKIMHRIAIALALVSVTLNMVFAQDQIPKISAQSDSNLNPVISVQPDNRVEVGEEIYFSATGTTYLDPALLAKARYEWDFGDGYAFKFGSPYYYTSCSSIAVTHYFMRPGNFTVSLTVSVWNQYDAEGNPVGTPVAVNTNSTVIYVTGEAPMVGFEIQRAPFHNRLAQYLYVTIPEAYRGNQTGLRVTLQGAKGYSRILLDKRNLAAEEWCLLDHKALVQDDYVVVAELLDGRNQRISGGLWRDKFSKRYPTIPQVGIDENNSFRMNGELFFPIGSFMTDSSKIKSFVSQAAINTLHTEGYYATHTPSTWKEYLNQANLYDLVAIGPARGDYEVSRAYWAPATLNRWKFNHNTDRMAQYVRTNKDQPAMFAWAWQDEPNMGGRAQKTYTPTLAAWAYVAHSEDPHHPSFDLFYGFDWSRYYKAQPNNYDYLASAPFFGGKKWMPDAIPFDIYPIPARLHPSINLSDMGPYAVYLDALDRIQSSNKHLVPVIPALMPNQRNPGEKVLLHSAEQVYLEAWLNVIHGAKGIIWFPYFDQSTIRWSVMKKFADQMKVLATVVLGPDPKRTVTDSANSPLNRVDNMVREKDGNVYIFAARVTEPDPIQDAKYQGVEPNSITVNFSVSGFSGNAMAQVVDEGRSILVRDGKFTDVFSKNAVHIYRIAAPRLTTPQRLRAIDDRDQSSRPSDH